MRSLIDPIDIYIGQRLYLARLQSGLSQERLGALEGITFQAIQKYEHGKTRLSVARMVRFSKHLGVPLAWFFDEMPQEFIASETPSIKRSRVPNRVQPDYEHEVEQILSIYFRISDKTLRNYFRRMMSLVAAPRH